MIDLPNNLNVFWVKSYFATFENHLKIV